MWLLNNVMWAANIDFSSSIGSHSRALLRKLGDLFVEFAAFDVFKRLLSWSAVRFKLAIVSLSDELLLSELFKLSELLRECESSLRYRVRLVRPDLVTYFELLINSSSELVYSELDSELLICKNNYLMESKERKQLIRIGRKTDIISTTQLVFRQRTHHKK